MNFSKMTRITTCNQFKFHLQNNEIIIFPIIDSTIYFLLDEDKDPVMCMQNKNGKLNVAGFSETKIEEVFYNYKAVMYVEKGAKLFMSKKGFKIATEKM